MSLDPLNGPLLCPPFDPPNVGDISILHGWASILHRRRLLFACLTANVTPIWVWVKMKPGVGPQVKWSLVLPCFSPAFTPRVPEARPASTEPQLAVAAPALVGHLRGRASDLFWSRGRGAVSQRTTPHERCSSQNWAPPICMQRQRERERETNWTVLGVSLAQSESTDGSDLLVSPFWF